MKSAKQQLKIKNLKAIRADEKIILKSDEERVFVWTVGPREKFEGNFEFLLEKGAKLKNIFLFSGAGSALYNVRMRVIHKGADSVSENIIRGVLRGRARAEVFGETVVKKNAARISSWLEEKALLFENSSARLDPRLEIKTSNVKKAGHAGTTTRIRDDELFYMASRGITKEKAIQLKSEGFLTAPLVGTVEPKLYSKILENFGIKLKK